MMFGSSTRINYSQKAEGIWGEFVTPDGRVNFLMTKAKLASMEPSLESRLTSLLCPVREVLDIRKMNFNQLLQRDLDDHRVATELLPYLIQPNRNGPAFFPPILAALLPFKGKDPSEEFPSGEYLSKETVDDFGEQPFEEWRYGLAYRFQRMVAQDGKAHPVKFGRLSWNDEYSKLVVLDGQHRAMALIAIERTLSGSWGQSTGSKYRHFYEHRIQALMEEVKGQGHIDLSQVEYPVTLCWFPEFSGQGHNPHVAARKLFVDVNKNARQPSEARLVLLSDTELVNIFTRSLLNRLREKNPPFPLYAVEYDNPDKESSRPVRWSVFTNITMLQNIVEKVVFGPSKYIKNMALSFRGRASESEMDTYMRRQLALEEVFPHKLDEGEERIIERTTLGNKIFPQYNKANQQLLVDRFIERWGQPILHVLGEFLPYKKHIQAMQELKGHWLTDDSIASLAYDAMFEGVGMYWTLRSSDAHWHERNRDGLILEKDKPEIVKAWKVIEEKGKNFKTLRANYLLGSVNEESVQHSENLYNVVNTYACQIGAIMTVATIRDRHEHLSVMEVAEILVSSWNASLEGRPVQSRSRMLLLSKEEKWPLNMIPKMDSPHAVYFRYFFLQFLVAEEAKKLWEGKLNEQVVNQLISESRRAYFEFLVNEKAKNYKRTEPAWSQKKRLDRAKNSVAEEFADSLRRWFNVPKEDFVRWLEEAEKTPSTQNPVDATEDETQINTTDEPTDELLDILDSTLNT